MPSSRSCSTDEDAPFSPVPCVCACSLIQYWAGPSQAPCPPRQTQATGPDGSSRGRVPLHLSRSKQGRDGGRLEASGQRAEVGQASTSPCLAGNSDGTRETERMRSGGGEAISRCDRETAFEHVGINSEDGNRACGGRSPWGPDRLPAGAGGKGVGGFPPRGDRGGPPKCSGTGAILT